MADTSRFTTGKETAKEIYDRNTGRRTGVCDIGRKMAELTIPTVMPPEGWVAGDDIPGNNQSIGAQCVANLASSLMFMAFPPGRPFVKMEAIEYEVQQQIDNEPELWAKMQLALSRLELVHRKHLQNTPLAGVYTRYLEIKLVAGNALWKHLTLKDPTCHTPDHYIVKRSNKGQPLLTIHKECVSLQSLDEDLREWVKEWRARPDRQVPDQEMAEWEEVTDIYSVCKLSTDDEGTQTWLYWEELEDGTMVPDTEVETEYDFPPMWPGWMVPAYGQDWGTSYCERYGGDLYTIEANSSSMNDGASLAALALLFVAPGSATSIKQVREARNLTTLPGKADDLTVFRSEKTADFNFVGGHLETVARRVAAAFLLQSSVQRSGERVTAEEIRRLGQELDKAMGGLYVQNAQGDQKIIVKRAIRLNEDEHPKLPPVPKEVEVQVITGIDAMGASTDYEDVVEIVQVIKEGFPEERILNGLDVARRLCAARGVKPDGMVLTPEDIASQQEQSQQTAMMGTVVKEATGPLAKGVADNLNQGGPPQGAA